MSRPVTEQDLHAYVDNALDPERRREVGQYLEFHSEDAARVRAYAAQRLALRAGMAARMSAAAPPELDVFRLLEARVARRRASWRMAAAVVLSLGVGGAAGWLSRGGLPEGPADRAIAALTSEALANHTVYAADARHPIEVEAVQRDHLVRWLSNRLDRNVTAPDLVRAGYHLLGGRLLATGTGGTAALFMYADAQGQRVSVLVRPMAPEIQVRQTDTQNSKLGVCAWIQGGLGYAVTGPLPDDELDRLADLVKGRGISG